MDKSISNSDEVSYSPPSRGLALGWRLALTTVLITSIVMGAISIGQQRLDFNNDRQLYQELLQMSLAPLAARLEASSNIGEMKREANEYHMAFSKKGYPSHEIVLTDSEGKQVVSTGKSITPEDTELYLQALVPVRSQILSGGTGTLTVLKDGKDYQDKLYNDWFLWVVHFIVTVGVIIMFLTIAMYYQVTKPVNRLMQGVKKMEMGYWGTVDLDKGAWEIRWLAWRFSNMVQEVHKAVDHLFEAEKKAKSISLYDSGEQDLEISTNKQIIDRSEPSNDNTPGYLNLLSICERLESAHPNNMAAVKLAHHVWEHEVIQANQLGYYQLKARLEDSALRLTVPGEYQHLDAQLSELKEEWKDWMEHLHNEISDLLDKYDVPCVNILHRVKHTAGVWSKMKNKGLNLEEIHDLYAFRIIVPTEVDCYAVMGITHNAFKPMVSRFKDYIENPKKNGYQSIHTCLTADDGPVFEIQIRSIAMDRQAENGDSAHWEYKKGDKDSVHKPNLLQRWFKKWHGLEKSYET